MVDEKKIHSRLISIKAMANTMLAEAEKIEQMLQKPSKRQMDAEASKSLMELSYQKSFQRRLNKAK